MVKPAQASGTVFPQPNSYCVTFFYIGGYGAHACSSSNSAACAMLWAGSSYSAACGGYCVSGSNCSLPVSVYGNQSFYTESTCPDNTTTTTPPCICKNKDPSVPNSITYVPNEPLHTSCVPAAVCTVTTKVADITDRVAKLYENGTYSKKHPDIEHLTQETQTGLACIQQKVDAANCYMTPQPTLGYRPTAYQTHILEVYDKWQLIKDDNTPACAEIKAAIKKEFDRHSKFERRPGVTSNHSHVDAQGNPAGNAVDISPVPQDIADAIACQCNMYRPMTNDAVHYQPRTCPR